MGLTGGLILASTLLIIAVTTHQHRRIIVNIQQLLDAVRAQKTVIDSAATLLARIHGELQGAINANNPAAIQAIADELAANTQELSAAVEANPALEPEPVVEAQAPAADQGSSETTNVDSGPG